MYAIIYWVGEDEIYPVLNRDKTLRLFDKLEEADKYADSLERAEDVRVITIDRIQE